ncbi:MAG: hypothetical protein ACM3XM_15730 [Mycobacterium leprae]
MESVLGLVRHSGNERLLKAIEMSLLATLSGQPLHIHAEGLRGTGKTTMMRAVRRVLPKIRRIRGCLYNCNPDHPHCPHHRGLSPEQIALLGDELVPIPFLEISHSAKVGTVVGSIDLSRLVSQTNPEAALLPGTIPQAHRGIIFVDEINRLAETAPELADVLLDVMGTKPGRVQIEETGLPAVELPVQVTVWAASNPDEDPGPLDDVRRQLSDRFDFVVYTNRPTESAVVEQILAAAAEGGMQRTTAAATETRANLYRVELNNHLVFLRGTQVSKAMRQHIAEIYSRFNVESLRAVQALDMGLRLTACLSGRREPALDDLAEVVPLALRHRVDQETLKKVTQYLAGLTPPVEKEPAVVAPVAPARQRFSSVGFGGAAAPLPAIPELKREGTPVPQGSPGAAGKTEPGQAAPEKASLPQTGTTAEVNPGWLGKAMAAMRRGFGFGTAEGTQPGPAGSPASPASPGSGSDWPARPLAAAGRLCGRPQGEVPNPAPGSIPGKFPGNGPDKPREALPDNPPGSGSDSAADSPLATVDPLKHPPESPPNLARPLIMLPPHEWIRTEEELGHR